VRADEPLASLPRLLPFVLQLLQADVPEPAAPAGLGFTTVRPSRRTTFHPRPSTKRCDRLRMRALRIGKALAACTRARASPAAEWPFGTPRVVTQEIEFQWRARYASAY